MECGRNGMKEKTKSASSRRALDASAQKCEEFFDVEWFTEDGLCFEAVLLGEANADIVIGLS